MGKNYIVYNDSQRLNSAHLTYIPSGYPSSFGYLVSKGNNCDATVEGISHNLKRPILECTERSYTNRKMTLLELYEKKLVRQVWRRNYQLVPLKMEIFESRNALDIMSKYVDLNIANIHSKLFPIMRLNFKGRR